MLGNLIGNAIKACSENGAITVSVQPAGPDVQFAIADNGHGIDPKHRPHLFDRYWRAPNQGRGGAGLGLFIAKGLVESHGGKIRIDSKPGVGSTFFFTLPGLPA